MAKQVRTTVQEAVQANQPENEAKLQAERGAGERTHDRPMFVPRVDIYETETGLIVAADLPGVKPGGLEVTLEKRVLSIYGRVDEVAPEGATLRRLTSFGAEIGAVCTGTYVLAKAGLLDGYQATIHWENHAGLVAEFPRLAVSQELFQIDRNRLTCAGGTAAVDMMLAVITRDHGPALASQVTDQLIHHRIREAGERQRMDLRARLGIAHPKLLSVVDLMEKTIENPLTCEELAAEARFSTRQLERLFRKYLGHSPTKHYQSIRLERARYLLKQTSMPILSIAMSCGFVSASHFSKSYNEHFGRTPSAERRRPQADENGMDAA